MSKYKKDDLEPEFEKIEAGVYDARIIGIIEVGTQETTFGEKFKLAVRYECVNETFEDKEGEEKNYVLTKMYNKTLHSRGDLAKLIKALTGETFEDEDTEFEMDDLLNAACVIQVEESEEGDYRNITNVMKPRKDKKTGKLQKIDKAENKPISLYLDDNFDSDVFDDLPDWLQKKIEDSPEYEEVAGEKPKSKKKAKKKAKDEDDEDEDEPKSKKKVAAKKKKKPADDDEDEEEEEDEDEDIEEDDDEEEEEDDDDEPVKKKKTPAKKGKVAPRKSKSAPVKKKR